LTPDLHVELTGYGVAKKNHVDFDRRQADELLQMIEEKIEENNLYPLLNANVEKCEAEN